MAPDSVYLPEDLALFDVLSTPVWIVDLARGHQWWANLACVPMWGAADREQLLAASAAGHLAELERHRQQIAAQADALLRLAAPVIRVGARVLALPLIGALDRQRVDVALAALLEHTGRSRVDRVVVDLTGAAVDDAEVAAGVLRIVRVLRLQGVAAALSGVRPPLARAIVGADIDLSEVRCYQSIEHALAGR